MGTFATKTVIRYDKITEKIQRVFPIHKNLWSLFELKSYTIHDDMLSVIDFNSLSDTGALWNKNNS